ncbi:hypothetical protein KIL84_008934 [Mauremys mutica]|uniref:Uncharacterized protein n=1 Tax=Mauremys mutica TaxID=74926 RepID=A0A9D3XIR9_9SAUR|nr:hypothetical protein KIL84_008934 [Mauremys mutica]
MPCWTAGKQRIVRVQGMVATLLSDLCAGAWKPGQSLATPAQEAPYTEGVLRGLHYSNLHGTGTGEQRCRREEFERGITYLKPLYVVRAAHKRLGLTEEDPTQ